MKYVSLDVETTGLDPSGNNILEIAAICDDTSRMDVQIKTLPRFHAFVMHDTLVWNVETLKMNWKLMEQILFGTDTIMRVKAEMLVEVYGRWLSWNGFDPAESVTYAGKNFGAFDKKFLEMDIPNWKHAIRVKHRALDPLVFFFNPLKDTQPPSLVECLKRLGVEGGSHRAVDDAEGVILCLRHGWKSGFYFGAGT